MTFLNPITRDKQCSKVKNFINLWEKKSLSNRLLPAAEVMLVNALQVNWSKEYMRKFYKIANICLEILGFGGVTKGAEFLL